MLASVAPENKYRYNGKEWNEDWGLNMYDYGARWYMPDLGRWGGVDALAESYYPFSIYSYALNNPLFYIDVDGKRLLVTFRGEGSIDEFKKIFNHMLQGQFAVTFRAVRDGKGNKTPGKYEIGIKATEGGGNFDKLSEGGKSFYKMAKEIIDSKVIVDIDVEYSNSTYNVADYDNNRIDIQDISAFPTYDHNKKHQEGPTDAGKLVHELREQFGKAIDGYKRGERKGYQQNHELAIMHEDAVNNNKRIGTKMTRNGIVQTYKTPDGRVTEWLTQIKNGRFIVKKVE